jgi:tungstate transport system substrate-binding protein
MIRSLLLVLSIALSVSAADQPPKPPAPSVRVAAIGGINDQGFWKAVADRFEQKTSIHVETVATGNKDAVADLFKRGGIDLVTVQAPQTITNLVADGFANDPQPWVRTELVIVGPESDPAGIKSMNDASAAVGKILSTKSPFVIHASLGADEVIRGIVQAGKGQLADGEAIVLLDDHQKRVLQVASDKHAYTLIAAAPFRDGKIPAGGLVELVKGDPILRRPHLLAVANPQKLSGTRPFEAHRLAEFLRSEETQQWIATWRPSKPGDAQPFFPVDVPTYATLPPGVMFRVTGDIDLHLDVTAETWAKLPRDSVKIPGKDGGETTYSGVLLRDILKSANVPLGNHQLRGPWANRTIQVHAADGYQTAFALAELDDDLAEHNIILVDQKDGKGLTEGEGPLRIIVPGEKRPMRWAKRVTVLEVR